MLKPRGIAGILAFFILNFSLFTVLGCGNRKSSLLLERQSRGPLDLEGGIARPDQWILEPATQTKTLNGVEITATYAHSAYLRELFSNRDVFGPYVGMNPFFREQLVFYIKIHNKSGKKLSIDPNRFVLLDEKGNQYHMLSADYGNALAEAKKSAVSRTARGVVDDASPGYFGVNLRIGKIVPESQQRFALLKMATLQEGFLYDGVIYDGLIAFWSPHTASQKLKLLLANVKTNFDPNDEPQALLDFSFEFASKHPQ